MKLSEIYQKLQCEKEWIHATLPETEITTVLPFSNNMPFEKNVLYISDASELPDSFDVSGLSFLCTNVNNVSLENYKSHNIIIAKVSSSQYLSNAFVIAFFSYSLICVNCIFA